MCYLFSYNNSFVILLLCLLLTSIRCKVLPIYVVIASVLLLPAFYVNCIALFSGKLSFFIYCFIIDITPGLLSSEDDAGTINEREMITNKEFPSERNYEKSNVMAEKKPLPSDIPSSLVLQIKSVFKCRLCPRVICLTEDTLRNHLQSKVLHFFLWFLNAYASIFTISATIV